MKDEPEIFTTVGAARYLGLPTRILERYRVTGVGPAFNRFGGRVRYRCGDLDAWAAGSGPRSGAGHES